ncbi:MAG: PKD domain-containing protein, partial [bacterium]|nr:PKD domain-containing protein [bacterium]
MQRFLVNGALAIAATSSLAVAQLTVVVPDGTANAPGNSSNAFPWGTNAAAWPGLRLMATYGSVNFTNQSINFPVLISGLKWRPNDTTGAVAGGQFNMATIELSTSPVGQANVTTNYATNHGPDRAVVYDASVNGPVIHTATPGSGAWTPQSWCIDVTFPTPFLYDPGSGDLVVDVDYPTGSFVGGGVGQMDVQSTGSNSSRVFASSLYPAANGITQNHGPVIEVTYVPAMGLYSIFSSDVTGGPSPLTVNFTDNSYSSDPGGVTSWAWDFDNDGTIDSTLQNPSHTYTACGTYDVALTVTDAVHPPATTVTTAYITTDTVSADFTEALIAPLVVQFTDTSTGTPTSWDWDLDGDGTTDATAQNPAFAYPNTSPVNVTLTVQRLCGPADTITRSVVPAQQLTTTFADNNGLSAAGPTMMFDMDVLNNKGIAISGLDINTSAAVSAPVTIQMYLTNGTYVGNEANPTPWVLLGTATGTAAGRGVPSPVAFPNPIYVAPGDYGIALHYVDVGVAYTNGNGANQMYANVDLSLDLGISRTSTPNAPFTTGGNISPRVWNGTIYYDTCTFSGNAGYGYAGT